MATIYQFPAPIPMTNGNYPQFKFAVFGDDLPTITTAGYLNSASIEAGMPLSNADVIMALYSFNPQTNSGSFGIFTVNIATATGQITLITWGNPGDVILPTTANYIAHFDDTIGTISSAAGNVIQPGNISAGLSGTAGTLTSFPSTAASGSLILAATNNSSGNFTTTITNASAVLQAQVITIPDSGSSIANFIISRASGTQQIDAGGLWVSEGDITVGSDGATHKFIMLPSDTTKGTFTLQATNNTGNTSTTVTNAQMGQASTLTIPDPANAAAQFLVGATATPFVSGNFPVASGTGGLMVDSGLAATNIQNKTNIKAGTSTDIGGVGAGPISVVVSGLTSSSVVVATIATSSNPVAVAKCVGGTNQFTITFTGDPGAVCTVNYIAFVVAQ